MKYDELWMQLHKKTTEKNDPLRKQMIYSWERGFNDDKEDKNSPSPNITIIQKDGLRKSGKALTKPIKGKKILDRVKIENIRRFHEKLVFAEASKSPSAETRKNSLDQFT